mgnify:CR=1 FL=1
MTDGPNEIRIDDLKAPVLTPMQKMVIDGFAGVEVEFTEDAVLGEAKERTGLSDFGPDDFRERLAVWCRAADEDANLGPMGQVRLFGDMVRYAANRLRFHDLLKRHPEILDLEIRKPIITEKATMASENKAVVFEVSIDANKPQIKEALESLFNVKVKAVNTTITKGKVKRFRGIPGRRRDVKKAYVTLEEGNTIDVTTGL